MFSAALWARLFLFSRPLALALSFSRPLGLGSFLSVAFWLSLSFSALWVRLFLFSCPPGLALSFSHPQACLAAFRRAFSQPPSGVLCRPQACFFLASLRRVLPPSGVLFLSRPQACSAAFRLAVLSHPQRNFLLALAAFRI